MNFKSGDTVKLKSGGPVMTIKWINGDEVACAWFDGKKPLSQEFELATLRAANPDEIDD